MDTSKLKDQIKGIINEIEPQDYKKGDTVYFECDGRVIRGEILYLHESEPMSICRSYASPNDLFYISPYNCFHCELELYKHLLKQEKIIKE